MKYTQQKNPMTQIWIMTHRFGTTAIGYRYYVHVSIRVLYPTYLILASLDLAI